MRKHNNTMKESRSLKSNLSLSSSGVVRSKSYANNYFQVVHR